MQMPVDPKYPEMPRRRFRPIPVRMLVPNVITLLAICAGLTSIRLSIEGRMTLAVYAVVNGNEAGWTSAQTLIMRDGVPIATGSNGTMDLGSVSTIGIGRNGISG